MSGLLALLTRGAALPVRQHPDWITDATAIALPARGEGSARTHDRCLTISNYRPSLRPNFETHTSCLQLELTTIVFTNFERTAATLTKLRLIAMALYHLALIATHSSRPVTQSPICRSDVPLRMAGSSPAMTG